MTVPEGGVWGEVVQEEGSLGRWRLPLILAVLVVGVALRLAAFEHHRVVDFDEGRYLDNAVHIMEGAGLSSSYTSHFFRMAPPVHPEEMSSPLYPWLLAWTFRLLDTPVDGMHRVAKLWSLAPGTLAIWFTFLLGVRLFDERTGLLAALMVAVNPDMVILSSWGMTESLYMLMVLGVLLLNDRLAPGSLRWVVLGGMCGLVYLLRTSGLAITAALGMTALLDQVRWRQRLVTAALFSVAFLATVSPWLARNQSVFGSPTYSSMKYVAWTESGRDLFTRDASPPTASRYLEEHGTLGMARNLGYRVFRTTRNLVWGDTGGYNLLSLLFVPAMLVTRGSLRLRAGHLSVLFTTLLLAGVHTWTGALSRYMLPLRPWIYLVVIGTGLHLLPAFIGRLMALRGEVRGAHSPEMPRRLAIALTATLMAVVGGVSGGPLRNYVEQDERGREMILREASLWIEGNTPEDSVLMEGALVHQYAFAFRRPVVWVPAGGIDELLRAAVDYDADYLVVSRELLRFRPALADHFESGEWGVQGVDLPEGFREVFAGTGRMIVIWKLPEPAP